jgi:hypothetical protein
MTKRTPPKITGVTFGRDDIDLETEVVLDEQGRRITNEYVERLVETAHAGRPSLTGKAEHSPRLAYRVAPGLKAKAVEVAKRDGKTLSDLQREALAAWVGYTLEDEAKASSSR